MEKKIITFITVIIVLIGLPYLIYNIYINHEDDIYRTLSEYASYTTIDKDYDIKVMNYRSVTGGEEVHHFKLYIVDNKTSKAYFIKNENVSAYGTKIDFIEDKTFTKYDVKIMLGSSSKQDMVIADLKEMRVKGQKFRAFLF